MTEASLTGNVLTRLRKAWPQAVVFKHADKLTFSVPDASVTGNNRTSWWEFKFANPGFKSPPNQHDTLRRLWHQGFAAYYVIFDMNNSDGRDRCTYIVEPSSLGEYTRQGLHRQGFDYNWIVNFILATHHNERMTRE